MKLLDIELSPERPLPRDFVDSLLSEGRAAGVILRRLKLNLHMMIFDETIQAKVNSKGSFDGVRLL